MTATAEPGLDMIGRDGELAAVDEILSAVRSGSGRAVVVRGEPGIGKSALLRYAQRRAQDFGCLLFLGSNRRCP